MTSVQEIEQAHEEVVKGGVWSQNPDDVVKETGILGTYRLPLETTGAGSGSSQWSMRDYQLMEDGMVVVRTSIFTYTEKDGRAALVMETPDISSLRLGGRVDTGANGQPSLHFTAIPISDHI